MDRPRPKPVGLWVVVLMMVGWTASLPDAKAQETCGLIFSETFDSATVARSAWRGQGWRYARSGGEVGREVEAYGGLSAYYERNGEGSGGGSLESPEIGVSDTVVAKLRFRYCNIAGSGGCNILRVTARDGRGERDTVAEYRSGTSGWQAESVVLTLVPPSVQISFDCQDSSGSCLALDDIELLLAETPSVIVTSSLDLADSFDCLITLREAILYARTENEESHIVFNLPQGSSRTITLASPLPWLEGSAYSIDGFDRSNNEGMITLNGNSLYPIFRIRDQAQVSINNLTFLQGYADTSYYGGGAIVSYNSRLAVHNTFFIDNISLGHGGAIYYGQNTDTAIIENCCFLRNQIAPVSGTYYLGGAIASMGPISIINTAFDSNSAHSDNDVLVYGGGIGVLNADVNVFNCAFRSGRAGSAGAIFVESSVSPNCRLLVRYSSFDANHASNLGGAIYTFRCESWIDNNTFSRNVAQTGGAFHIQDNLGSTGSIVRKTAVTNSTFVCDTARSSGGAISLNNAKLSLANNLFVGNVLSSSHTVNDMAVPQGNSNVTAYGNIWTRPISSAIVDNPCNVPLGVIALNQVSSAIDTVIYGVHHLIYPPLRNSVAALLGIATSSYDNIVSWSNAHRYGGSWYNSTTGVMVRNTNGFVLDTVDEVKHHRAENDSLISVGAIQRQQHYYDTLDVCATDSFLWHGHIYVASGDFLDTIMSNIHDSICHLHLTMRYNTDSVIMLTACDSMTWHGTMYTSSVNNIRFVTTNSVGCDSIVSLDLTINHGNHTRIDTAAIDSLSWHGTAYATSGTYTFSYLNDEGCLSTDTLQLQINHSSHETLTIDTCDSYLWHDSLYAVSGTHLYTYINSQGVPSTDTLHLNLRYGTSSTEVLTACDSLTWHGTMYTSSVNNIRFVTTNSVGCDSIVSLDLTIFSSIKIDTVISSCDAYYCPLNSTTYFDDTNVLISYGITQHNCDSLLNLNLFIHHSTQQYETIHACDSFVWQQNSHVYYHDVVDSMQFLNHFGCDSTCILILSVDSSFHYIIDTSCCGSFYWNLTDSMYYNDSYCRIILSSSQECDSIIELNLNINHIDTTLISDTICQGTGVNFHGRWCDSNYCYHYLDTNIWGCDSLISLDLTILVPAQVNIEYQYNCKDSSYHLYGITDAPYLSWHMIPSDSGEFSIFPDYALAKPTGRAMYIIQADLHDTLFCPSYDTIALAPPSLPIASFTTVPNRLKETNLNLQANSNSQNADLLHWFINDYLYADSITSITYVADINSDSISIMLVAANDLCSDTMTQIVPIVRDELFVPNVFIPQRDDVNGQFCVFGKDLIDIEINVYNRFGLKVYHSVDLQSCWNGNCDGKACPQGTYSYYIRYRTAAMPNGYREVVGTVLLLR